MESFKFFVHPVAKYYKYAGQHCVLGQHNTEIESVNRAGILNLFSTPYGHFYMRWVGFWICS